MKLDDLLKLNNLTEEKARRLKPGDQLRILVRTAQKRPPVWKFEGEAYVDGKLAADASFAAMLAQVPD